MEAVARLLHRHTSDRQRAAATARPFVGERADGRLPAGICHPWCQCGRSGAPHSSHALPGSRRRVVSQVCRDLTKRGMVVYHHGAHGRSAPPIAVRFHRRLLSSGRGAGVAAPAPCPRWWLRTAAQRVHCYRSMPLASRKTPAVALRRATPRTWGTTAGRARPGMLVLDHRIRAWLMCTGARSPPGQRA